MITKNAKCLFFSFMKLPFCSNQHVITNRVCRAFIGVFSKCFLSEKIKNEDCGIGTHNLLCKRQPIWKMLSNIKSIQSALSKLIKFILFSFVSNFGGYYFYYINSEQILILIYERFSVIV